MLQMYTAEDEQSVASLFHRVQEMNNLLLGVQAHYAESDEYQPMDPAKASKHGNTREFRGHFNRVWNSSGCCSPEEFTTWWCSWVDMLRFELDYMAALEREQSRDETRNTALTWKTFIAGMRQQVDNAVNLLQEIRRSAYEIMPDLELTGFPEVPEDAVDTCDRRFISVCAKGVKEEEEKRHREIARLAAEALQSEELQFDLDARVADGDNNGAYVQAWTWFGFSGTKFDKTRNADAVGAL